MNLSFGSYGIVGSLTPSTLAIIWLSVFFSLAANLFWLIDNSCFSAARRDRSRAKPRTNVGYKQIPDPDGATGHDEALPTENLPLQQLPTDHVIPSAYEPYRGQGN
jgi:hypothetical protein